jgi:hypothetical protein
MKSFLIIACFLAFAASTPVNDASSSNLFVSSPKQQRENPGDAWGRVKSPMENPKYFDFLSKLYSQQNFDQNPFRGGRIVGGSPASQNQFPFQIYGYYDDSWLCGGSIISSNFILTVKIKGRLITYRITIEFFCRRHTAFT